jgi:hypothetical protein
MKPWLGNLEWECTNHRCRFRSEYKGDPKDTERTCSACGMKTQYKKLSDGRKIYDLVPNQLKCPSCKKTMVRFDCLNCQKRWNRVGRELVLFGDNSSKFATKEHNSSKFATKEHNSSKFATKELSTVELKRREQWVIDWVDGLVTETSDEVSLSDLSLGTVCNVFEDLFAHINHQTQTFNHQTQTIKRLRKRRDEFKKALEAVN